jgi:hypothetical protein
MYKSQELVGAGADMKVAHGLGVVPKFVFMFPSSVDFSNANRSQYVLEGIINPTQGLRRRDFGNATFTNEHISVWAAPGKKFKIIAVA